MRSTPTSVPQRLPLPPKRLVPPMTMGGDDSKFDAGAPRRGRGTDAADCQDGGYTRTYAGKEIDEKGHAIDVDAREPRSLAVAADSVDTLSERCPQAGFRRERKRSQSQ